MIKGITLLVTKRCDLQCEHCLRGHPKNKDDFPLSLLDKLLNEAMQFGAGHVGLTGGEPHLHRQFDQVVSKIVSYGFSWGFASHGQRTKPYLPLMEKYREQFRYARLSLDGATPAIHDEIRGRIGSFEVTTHLSVEGLKPRKACQAEPVGGKESHSDYFFAQ